MSPVRPKSGARRRSGRPLSASHLGAATPLTARAETLELGQFVEKSYLDYSMTVILDRALPQLGDGLKPVQRRILYAMHELGLGAGQKFKKSARTVGDVIGKFHPHGDQAAYEALVLMAQPFSCRYPLVEGQGNFGSPDNPKSFAAMRYTETRLSRYADLLLAELGQGTVDWITNFDGTLEEPAWLPARLPWALLNGSSGIAVGMATDIPPHNLGETANALIHLIDHPAAGLDEVLEHLPGPDFPTEAEIITPRSELRALYETGIGNLRLRARYHLEDTDLVVDALPYQVSGSQVLADLARLFEAGELPWVRDLRDESDHEHPTRLVISLRGGHPEIDAAFRHLCAVSGLEKSLRVNLNVVTPAGAPRVMGLLDFLKAWLLFRLATLERRLGWQRDRLLARLEILEGLRIVHLDIDRVIRVIREAEEPRAELMRVFQLNERQADAILDMRLRQLARLEALAIERESAAARETLAGIEAALGSPRKLRRLVRTELAADRDRFGDARRSSLVERDAALRLVDDPKGRGEPVTVVLTARGWIRTARGHEWEPEQGSYRSGDGFLDLVRADSRSTLVLFDSMGRIYNLDAEALPDGRGPGMPLTSRLDPPPGARFVALTRFEPEERYVWVDSLGYGLCVLGASFLVRARKGRTLFRLPEGACALAPAAARHATRIALMSSAGQLLVLARSEVPVLDKGRGVRLMGIPPKARASERLLFALGLGAGDGLRLERGSKRLVLSPIDLLDYEGARGRRGRRLKSPWNLGVDRISRVEGSAAHQAT
ncbi:MAG: DNA topoisomerase IV subunit A [Gammaproteobacteria bacterium]